MVFVLVDWSCLVAKRMIVVRDSQLVGTTCRTRDFGSRLPDAAVFPDFYFARNGVFHGRSPEG
jgi:hypothetical protein